MRQKGGSEGTRWQPKQALMATQGETIESSQDSEWGAGANEWKIEKNNGSYHGENTMGNILNELRDAWATGRDRVPAVRAVGGGNVGDSGGRKGDVAGAIRAAADDRVARERGLPAHAGGASNAY